MKPMRYLVRKYNLQIWLIMLMTLIYLRRIIYERPANFDLQSHTWDRYFERKTADTSIYSLKNES